MTDPAVINSSLLMVKALVAEMRVVIGAIGQFDAEIEALCQTHSDFQIFASLPGSGTLHAARLLAAFGTQRDRFDSADAVASFSGIAPVIERSGQSCWIRWRYFCPKFVRQSFHEYAGESIKHSAWARAFYAAQRQRGKSRAAAVRALAFKWIRIIWRCWQTRTQYDEVVYLQALKRSNSPLTSAIEAAEAASVALISAA